MIGILLAGGAATRLPNKPLLPQHNLSPVCFSGMDYLLRHKVDHIAVVTPPSSVLVDIIGDHYDGVVPLDFIYQADPTGVGDALNMVGNRGSVMIVMADNIYPPEELVFTAELQKPGAQSRDSYAIIRHIAPWRIPHLVRVGPDNHLTRNGPGRYALTTPWILGAQDANRVFDNEEPWRRFDSSDSLIERPGEGWWDVGTPDTYTAYWRTPCKDK